MILLIGLAVGVDYSLFYLRREREERAGRRASGRRRVAGATSGPGGPPLRPDRIIAMSGMFLTGDNELLLPRGGHDPRRGGLRPRLPDGAAGAAAHARRPGRRRRIPFAVAGDPPGPSPVMSALVAACSAPRSSPRWSAPSSWWRSPPRRSADTQATRATGLPAMKISRHLRPDPQAFPRRGRPTYVVLEAPDSRRAGGQAAASSSAGPSATRSCGTRSPRAPAPTAGSPRSRSAPSAPAPSRARSTARAAATSTCRRPSGRLPA